jgi:hypothetical protein
MRIVIQRLVDWHTAIVNGEEVDVASIEVLMREVCELAPTASKADVARAVKVIGDLEPLVRERYQELGEELRRLGEGRTALKGYNHIRGYSEGQRLYRRA